MECRNVLGVCNRMVFTLKCHVQFIIIFLPIIRESVDSLCRDGTDSTIYTILKQKPYNFTTNMLKAYLTLYTRMTTIVVMNIGTLITNDDYSHHGHYRVVSALPRGYIVYS